jgi:hypothetical protein
MKKFPRLFANIAAIFLVFSGAQAVEFQSPRTLSLGGAGRAGPWLTDSIYLNPSFASYTPIYVLSGAYTGFNQGRNYNVSVQDSRTEIFQAGAGFTKREQNTAINLGASKAFMKSLGVGVGSKLLFDNGSGIMTSDFNVSSSYIAAQWMYVSVIIDNLIAGQAQTNRQLIRTGYVAFKFIPTKKVEFFVDPFFSPDYSGGKKAGYHAGIELGIMDDLYFRVGKFQDAEITHLNTRGSGFGIGGAWVGPKLSLEYAMSRALSTHSGVGFTTAQSGSVLIYF